MYNRADLDMIIAREKQRDLPRPADRSPAPRRTWERLTRWLDRLCPGERADRGSRPKDTDAYLLQALAWMMAKE